MTSRALVTTLFVVVVAVTGCRTDKSPPPPPPERENPFMILKDGKFFVDVVGKDGKDYLIQAQTIWKCEGTQCSVQAQGCPTCSVCDCRRIDCIKWCMKPPVLEQALPVPGGDPGVQPTPTAPK